MAVNDVLVNGMALNNFGLTDTNTVNGYGLNTFGLVWECGSFWFGPYYTNGLTTVVTGWSLFLSYTTVSTTWSLYTSGVTISTSWSLFTTSDQSCTEY